MVEDLEEKKKKGSFDWLRMWSNQNMKDIHRVIDHG